MVRDSVLLRSRTQDDFAHPRRGALPTGRGARKPSASSQPASNQRRSSTSGGRSSSQTWFANRLTSRRWQGRGRRWASSKSTADGGVESVKRDDCGLTGLHALDYCGEQLASVRIDLVRAKRPTSRARTLGGRTRFRAPSSTRSRKPSRAAALTPVTTG